MHRAECGRILRSNNKARKRGVVVNDQVEAAETFESWLGVLVSDFTAAELRAAGYRQIDAGAEASPSQKSHFEDVADGCTFIDGE
jgi:hypothetical protein